MIGTAEKITVACVIASFLALVGGILALALYVAVKGQGAPQRRVVVLNSGRGLLPLWLHLVAHFFASLILFFGGGFILGSYFAKLGAAGWIAYPGGAIFGAAMSRCLFCELFSARCPACRGRMFRGWGSHIIYACRDCGYVHDTGITASSHSGPD